MFSLLADVRFPCEGGHTKSPQHHWDSIKASVSELFYCSRKYGIDVRTSRSDFTPVLEDSINQYRQAPAVGCTAGAWL